MLLLTVCRLLCAFTFYLPTRAAEIQKKKKDRMTSIRSLATWIQSPETPFLKKKVTGLSELLRSTKVYYLFVPFSKFCKYSESGFLGSTGGIPVLWRPLLIFLWSFNQSFHQSIDMGCLLGQRDVDWFDKIDPLRMGACCTVSEPQLSVLYAREDLQKYTKW